MQFRSTTFTWETGKGDTVSTDFAPGAARTSAPIFIKPGTAAAALQAAQDLLGQNVVKTATVTSRVGPGGTVIGMPPTTRFYVSRVTPFPLPRPPQPNDAPAVAGPQYAQSLQDGCGVGVGAQNTAWGDYTQYRQTATFTPRSYFVKEDATQTADPLPNGQSSNTSPLWDPNGNGGAGVGYPDEGSRLRGGWLSSRYVTRRVYPAGRLIEVPVGFTRFADGAFCPAKMPFREAIFRVVYTWHLVPLAAVPLNAIQKAQNAVNADLFDVWPTETMMLTGFKYDPQPGPLSDYLTDVEYEFQVKLATNRFGVSLGHSAALRVLPGGSVDWDRVVSVGDNTKGLFRRWPMCSLFRPDQPGWQPDSGAGGG